MRVARRVRSAPIYPLSLTASQATPSNVRFGQTSGSAAAPGFGRAGALAGVALIVVVLGGLLWSANASPAASARHPRLFGGSLVLEDQRQLTVIDVATGAVVAGLQSANSQVGARAVGDVQAVPVSSGTVLIDRRTGTFNQLDKDNYVIDAAGAGVGLGALPGLTGASGLAAGDASYIVRYAPRSTVSLVDESTVAVAAKVDRPGVTPRVTGAGTRARPAVTPRGFAALGGPVANQSGSAAVSGHDLWALVGAGSSCRVTQIHPVATARNGLTATRRARLATPCQKAAAEAIPGAVGVASPGQVRLFPYDPQNGRLARQTDTPVPGTRSDTQFLPVGDSTGTLWFLAGGGTGAPGWSVFGVNPSGKVTGPSPLTRFSGNAEPAPPVESGGTLYTLDRASRGQPTLWTILPATGAMIPVPKLATYPARAASEKAAFTNAEVVVDGPRVVFNNPGSLLAVVVFTDGSHVPVVVDKSSAVTVSTVGPTVAGPPAAPPRGRKTNSNAQGPVPPASTAAAPAVQPVNPAVTCATTTQKPYAPQIITVQPSSGSALVAWSYQLLDQGDCEPDSWSVQVKALSSSHQPAQPVQVVNGQTELQFTGLRPATTYQAVVTAYINAQSTPSTPATFTTAARGPDAPIAVHTVANGQGGWVVSWAPCTAASCVVPASSWNVIGTDCGSSFVGQPPAISVPAGQNTVTINAGSYGLLGDSLSFSVQGTLSSGLTGDPTSDHACTEAWQPPNPAAIHLADAGTLSPDGQSITGTLEVSTVGSSPVEAFGSNSTEFVYQIGSLTIGPTPSTKVIVPGLKGGTPYTPTVRVYPAGHSSAFAVVTGPPFSTTLNWPASLAVTVSAVINSATPNDGSLQIAFSHLPSGPMTATGDLQCGNLHNSLSGPIAANGALPTLAIDLVTSGSSCSLALTVTDTATPNPYGIPSPPLGKVFSFGPPPTYSFTDEISPVCQQQFCPPGDQQIQVNFSGPTPRPTAGGNWTITSAGGQGNCMRTVGLPTPVFPYTLGLPPSCRDASSVDVTVAWEYLGQPFSMTLGPPAGTAATTTTSSTSTSTSTSTTSSTTVPRSTTSTRVPRSTTSSSSTTLRSTTSAPTPAAAAAALRSVPVHEIGAAQLIASRAPLVATGQTPRVAGDPQVRAALEWVLLSVAAAGAWRVWSIWRAPRRKRKQQRRTRS